MLRSISILLVLLLVAAGDAQEERFNAYPATLKPIGRLAMPRLQTPEQKRYRHVLQRAITKGYDVVEGGTEHERRGPNFAGVFVLVQWGCGSDCMQGALIDTRDGSVLTLPAVPDEEPALSFQLPTGSADLRTLQFRTASRLLGIPSRRDGYTYYFSLEGRRWRLRSKQKTPATP